MLKKGLKVDLEALKHVFGVAIQHEQSTQYSHQYANELNSILNELLDQCPSKDIFNNKTL